MPKYPGTRQSIEVSKSAVNKGGKPLADDSDDWAAQYQAYLDEQDAENEGAAVRNEAEGNGEEAKDEGGDGDWAVQYQKYCEEKEMDFFPSTLRN